MVIKGLANAGLTDSGARSRGEAVRARRRLGGRARRGGPPLPAGVPALPDRPLPGQDGARRDPLPAVREHDVRADLEPQLHRLGPDHDGGELRRGGPRPLLRPGGRAARRRRQPPHAGDRGHGDGAAGQQRLDDPEERDGLGLPGHAGGGSGPLRPRAVRRLPRYRWRAPPTRRPRPTPPCASRSTAGAGPASRSSSARASTCRSRRRSCGSSSRTRRGFASGCGGPSRPTPNQLVVRLDPTTGIQLLVDAQRADSIKPEQISLDMEFAQEGGEGATPYEVLLHAAMVGDSKRFTRQDAVEQAWRVMQPLLDSPPPVHAVRAGFVGSGRRRRARRRTRQVARPVGGRHEPERGDGAQSAAAPSPFPPIADYAFLSNCHTGALVAPDGSSTGSACRASTPRACSARCSTARPAASDWGRSG